MLWISVFVLLFVLVMCVFNQNGKCYVNKENSTRTVKCNANGKCSRRFSETCKTCIYNMEVKNYFKAD